MQMRALVPAAGEGEVAVGEEILSTAVNYCVLVVEGIGALIIIIGALVACWRFLRVLPRRHPGAFVPVRLGLGRYLVLGLEFQLASDVLKTAVAPSFEELGKLAAVAAIRTVLNYFLTKEIAEEQRLVDEARAGGDHGRLTAHGSGESV